MSRDMYANYSVFLPPLGINLCLCRKDITILTIQRKTEYYFFAYKGETLLIVGWRLREQNKEYRFLVFTPAVGFEELLLSVQPVQNDGMRKFRSSVERVPQTRVGGLI